MHTANLHKRILISTLLISALLRVLAALYLGNQVEVLPGTFDQISYHNLAMRVLSGAGFTFAESWWPATAAGAPTAHWSYLFTGYLIGVYKLFGINPLVARLIQALLVGILQPYLVYIIARRIFNPQVGLAAAALTAVYSYFIYYSATLMTEPFYIIAILVSLWVSLRIVEGDRFKDRNMGQQLRYGLLLGLSLGAGVLLRQLFLLVIPFIFLWIWWASGRRNLRYLSIAGVVILLMVIPFTIFNYLRFERFVLLNTNAGYALFWSNHPIYGTQFVPILPEDMGSYSALIPDELRSLDEAALDQKLLSLGIGFIVDDFPRYLLLSLSRIPHYFMFWPSRESGLISNITRVSSFGILWPFMLYGLYRSYIERVKPLTSQPVFLLYLFIFTYSLIHILTWTLIRYRLPVDAILVIFAGLAFVNIAERVPALRKFVVSIA